MAAKTNEIKELSPAKLEVNRLISDAMKALKEYEEYDQEKIDYFVVKCSVTLWINTVNLLVLSVLSSIQLKKVLRLMLTPATSWVKKLVSPWPLKIRRTAKKRDGWKMLKNCHILHTKISVHLPIHAFQ